MVPIHVTLWGWQMLVQCVILREAALLLKMMGCRQRLQWHMNWVKLSVKKYLKHLNTDVQTQSYKC